MSLKLVTWNVNSVRARLDRLVALLGRHAPDVLCLQELKAQEEQFPHDAIRAAGYHAAIAGQKGYNGVAILSRTPLEDVTRGLDDGVDDPQARLISARVAGIRVYCVYVPNGEAPSSPKLTYKLTWMDRLARKLEQEHDLAKEELALSGDFNVAPTDLDVRIPRKWADTVLCRPEVREKLARIRGVGLIDSLRHVRPDEPGLYSYWDYGLAFAKNDGLRIDHVDVSAPLAQRLLDVVIDRDERTGEKPSDHAPVIATFT